MMKIRKRSLKRRERFKKMKIVKMGSEEDNSFHLDLKTQEAWALMIRLKEERYYQQTGEFSDGKVKRDIIQKMTLDEMYKQRESEL